MKQSELLNFIQTHDHIKILVIQTAFIGDVVLTTPMLKILKKHFPNSKLSVLVKPEAKSILENLSFIDEVIVIDKQNEHKYFGMIEIIRKIQEKNFDIILSPHQSFRTSLIVYFSRGKFKVGYDTASWSFVYDYHVSRNPHQHEIHRLLKFLKDSLLPEFKDFTNTPILEETEDGIRKAKELLKFFTTKPVAFATSSIWPTKRWTSWGFAELAVKVIDKLKAPVILIGSKADYEVSEHIRNFVKLLYPDHYYHKIHNLCGKTDLPTLYSLLKRCKLLVSNDSAPVHFGCAAGIPVVAIFGPTTKELGYAPICDNSAVVEIEGLYCRPCGTHGGKKCPEKHFRCMREITPDMVIAAIEKLKIN
ncbi:MAG: lipopolysaccharide heptosyltransferase II [Leptospiraceae bacterium]|nr:lipopolysaccharide heptosyltransferase II [Leptospiraceae bacterium]MDW7976363.1 lipopolysaccharide heptosyltransferase II [Leptospiraceae bacterium]